MTELGGRRHCTRLRIAGNPLVRDATTRPAGRPSASRLISG